MLNKEIAKEKLKNLVADLAKVPMPKIYGSVSVPAKVIKILSITTND